MVYRRETRRITGNQNQQNLVNKMTVLVNRNLGILTVLFPLCATFYDTYLLTYLLR